EYLDERTIAIRSAKAKSKGSQQMSRSSPADQMLLASLGSQRAIRVAEAGAAEGANEDDDAREVVVEDTRLRPYTDRNADLPRTINDVQPYFIYDAQMIEQAGAITVEEFLQNHVTMNQYGGIGVSNITNTTSYGSNSGVSLRGLGIDR